MLTLAADVSHIVGKAIKVDSQVRPVSAKGRVARDGLDYSYLIHSAGKDNVRKPNMQNDRADRVYGIFKRR